MSKIRAGFAFHCHHDILVEYVHDYDERMSFIRLHKPFSEQLLRLHLFQLIPTDKLPTELVDVISVEVAARDARNKASDTYGFIVRRQEQPSSKERQSYREVIQAHSDAEVKCITIMGKYLPELKKLHNSICPNCPWDGDTIFPIVHR